MLKDKKGVEQELIQINHGEQKKVIDLVAKEIAVGIFVNQKKIVNLNSSPGNLKYLATGFLYSIGLLKDKRDIISLKTIGKAVYFQINNPESPAGILDLTGQFRPITPVYRKCNTKNKTLKLDTSTIYSLLVLMQEKAEFFKISGGVHSCGLANHAGRLLLFCEDISRYNTIDRILGEAILKDIDTKNKVMLTSCRITAGIMHKIIKGNVPIVISRSAVTDCAIQLAERYGVTLIGFARGERMNIYTHPERITG
ncbi:MAG TPA: formate dehydrogenase accessory sulfurtransferase FdhD [Atribacterota bacterium]|nr:formate dehydrogenase accessory sulfurtransferase FdhD [Atribacterota bacterium]